VPVRPCRSDRAEKKAEAEELTGRLHRLLVTLNPEGQLRRVELGQRAAGFTGLLRPAWDPGRTTLLHRSVYAAVLDFCDAAEVTRKNAWT
jgi:hypothetical protein